MHRMLLDLLNLLATDLLLTEDTMLRDLLLEGLLLALLQDLLERPLSFLLEDLLLSECNHRLLDLTERHLMLFGEHHLPLFALLNKCLLLGDLDLFLDLSPRYLSCELEDELLLGLRRGVIILLPLE